MKLRNSKAYDSTAADASWRSKVSSQKPVKTAENPALPTVDLDEKVCPVTELQDYHHLATSDATVKAPEIMDHSGKRRIPFSGGHQKKKPKRKHVKKNSVPQELTRTIDRDEKLCPVTQDHQHLPSPSAAKDPEIMDHPEKSRIQKVMDDVESVESLRPNVSEPSKDESAVKSTVGGGNFKLRLLHRYMLCEWFYCDMDRSLLGRECKTGTMESLLQRFYPELCNRKLNRATWGRIRRSLCKEPSLTVPRRCSSAFFNREREYLKVGRNKIRALQAIRTAPPTLEYLDGDLPPVLPPSIEAQATVRAHLDTDGHYGVFEGIVINVAFDTLCNTLYTVSFGNPNIGVKVVPDTHIAQTLPTGSASFQQQYGIPSEPAGVWVPNTVPNLMALMHQELAELDAALGELQNLRHQIAAQQALGTVSSPREGHRELVQSYESCLQQVQSRGRSLTNQLGTAGLLYGKSVTEDGGSSLTIGDALQDRNVVEIAQKLCSQPDVGAIACRTRWNNSVALLHTVPAHFHALREQIESKLNASK